MLKGISHLQGVKNGEEILFDTPFGYIFEYLCNNSACRLPDFADDPNIIQKLQDLGGIMADPGEAGKTDNLDSQIPAIYTYLGQFIDHDITARTDRDDQGMFRIQDPQNVRPLDPDTVVANLKNGRRPNLDLDSVFGDGPSFSSAYQTQADDLYEDSFRMKINRRSNYIDLPRNPGTSDPARAGEAIIADHRNDENVMIGQLHAAIIAFYNRVFDRLPPRMGKVQRYIRARQLTTWTFQYMVVNDYLMVVCDPDIVQDTLDNGPFYFGQFSNAFMPLEFSVAGFRFGHSMIRPFYNINGQDRNIENLLLINRKTNELLDPTRNYQLKPQNVIRWSDFVRTSNGGQPQMARIIDSRIAKGLFELDKVDTTLSGVMAMLAQRNLLRGYLLSLPTGQSMAKAMRIFPLSPAELQIGNNNSENTFLQNSGFLDATPLWYYILKEAEVQQQGQRLGAVGSRLVAETLIGLLKKDPNSYLNNIGKDDVITDNGIDLSGRTDHINNIAEMLHYAGVPL